MRTTLTLDDDVAALVRRAVREGRSLRDVINEGLRRGLQVSRAAPRRRYRVTPLRIGGALVPNLDDVAEVLAVADGDDHT